MSRRRIMSSSPGKAPQPPGLEVLEREIRTSRAKLPELLQHEGKFVLILGDDVVDFFTSYEDALKQGYDKFGLGPFLVKQVQRVEQALWISRFAPSLRRVS